MEYMEETVHTLAAFEQAAAAFITSLIPNVERATLITLSGDLGAGKTAFVKAAARHLCIPEEVTSPTFVLQKAYEVPEGEKTLPWRRLVHLDVYRLAQKKDLDALRFSETLSDRKNLIMVEWPEQIGDFGIKPDAHLVITTLPQGGRIIRYES